MDQGKTKSTAEEEKRYSEQKIVDLIPPFFLAAIAAKQIRSKI